MMVESGLQVDDEEGGAVEGEGGVTGDEGLPGLLHQLLVAVACVVEDEYLIGCALYIQTKYEHANLTKTFQGQNFLH